MLALITAAGIGAILTTHAFACSTICLLEKDRAVVAYNYDFYFSEGLVLVNKRDTRKKSWVEPQAANWTARYGSVTFNQFGRDNPSTGVNEKGLMASIMWLNGTRYPPADDRAATGILEWVQYNLDRHASVAEVVADADAVRPTSRTPIHYLFADAGGDAAVVEFLNGKLTLYRGNTMPVKALTNSTYAHSVAAYDAFKKSGVLPAEKAKTKGVTPGFGSLDRFVRGAIRPTGEGDPIARGFAILDVVKQGLTRWSIVYDLSAGEVHFKTDTNKEIRRITVSDFNFSCNSPPKMLGITAPGSGDVQNAFVEYTGDANRSLLKVSLSGRPYTFIDKIATHPDLTSSCSSSN